MTTQVAPYPKDSTEGNRSAITPSAPGYKTLSSWRKVGRIERHGQGVQIEYRDLVRGELHEVFINAKNLHDLITRQIPCDVVSIRETPNEIVTSMVGRAYRSRSGKALMLRLVDMAGAEAVSPWKNLMMVMDGTVKAAPLSIIEEPAPRPPAQAAPLSTFDPRAGMQRGFT